MKFTKGKWIAVGAWVEHQKDNKADICSCNPEDFGQEHYNRSYEEQCANAKLIAQAPNMLKTLKRLVAALESNLDQSYIDSNIEAAIKVIYAAQGK